MAIDFVRQAVARTLKVPLSNVGRWDVTASQNSHAVVGSTLPGMLDAAMTVKLNGPVKDLSRFLSRDICGSAVIVSIDPCFDPLQVEVSLQLLYGKETQHIFKALAQMFRIRGKQPKRRK